MTLYAHIVDGILQSVGDLPLSARRLDTLVLLGPGEVSERLTACGYFPLNVDLSTLPPWSAPTAGQRAGLFQDLAAASARQVRRSQFEAAVTARADLARDINWDLIDQFCHPTVASILFVSGQSPNAGASWGAPTAAQAADRLRLMVSYLLVETIQMASALDMLTSVVSDLIDGADIDPPADR